MYVRMYISTMYFVYITRWSIRARGEHGLDNREMNNRFFLFDLFQLFHIMLNNVYSFINLFYYLFTYFSFSSDHRGHLQVKEKCTKLNLENKLLKRLFQPQGSLLLSG